MKSRQLIPVIDAWFDELRAALDQPVTAHLSAADARIGAKLVPPFDAGHLDGFADATNNNPRDPEQRFKTWQRRRDVDDFAEYERGYVASFDQVVREMQTREMQE